MAATNRARSSHLDEVSGLCRSAFGADGPTVTALTDANRGRGAFSVVLRAALSWPPDSTDRPEDEPADHDPPADRRANAERPPDRKTHPASVVAKLPIGGHNGRAAVAGGAYRREALAYRELLVDAPIATPRIHAVAEPGDGTASFLMEDLSAHRAYDQLVGLPPEIALEVATELARFHRAWADDGRLGSLPVRRNTVAGLPDDALSRGLETLETTWSDQLNDRDRRLYQRLVAARPSVVERFDRTQPTLCHGDPRADNFVFDRSGRLVLFDWQQIAVQFGEADLAWLAATSLQVEARRRLDRELVAAYEGDLDRYRLGLALPGLTVLLLAQRELGNDRTERFVAASLQRIAAALDDLDVLDLF